MKKLLAILLVLALLLPMGMVAHAEEAEKDPFYFNQWNDFTSDLSNIYDMPFFWGRLDSSGQVDTVTWGGNDGTLESLAEILKDEFNSHPDGARYINFAIGNIAFRTLPVDVIFVDDAVKAIKDWTGDFLKVYKSIGGKLDGLILDLELENTEAYYIQTRLSISDPLVYDKIVSNPKYETDIRPYLVERGFEFYDKITEYTPEIYSIHSNSGDTYVKNSGIWDAVIQDYLNRKMNEACAPLWEYYPDAEMSDYQSKSTKVWLNGLFGSGINTTHPGTSSNNNCYSVMPATTFFLDPVTKGPGYPTIAGYNSAIYEDTPFSHFLYEANGFKNIYLASDSGKVSWWVSHYMYNQEVKTSASLTPYYVEQLLHMGMLNPEHFLGYITQENFGFVEETYEFCLQIIDDVMDELTRMVGYADRKPISVTPAWNYNFVLSGMYANGRNVWRLTPDTGKVSVEDFKVEGTDPTFSVNGTTVTFPGGKIIADGKITGAENFDADALEWDTIDNNTCGYWIETAANVEPVITRTENYHSEYPAYVEDYESYKAGMEYNYNNALPVACWEVKKSGSSSATVVANPADANDQVLALKGTYTIRNVKMPKNITAGDTYAEHQAWEVSVTLPSDLAADAELVLLNAASDKKKTNDGGFKIAGGKVYYSQNGEYVELPDVTITAGTEYTLVREVDFSNPDAFTSDYFVYDASGNLLGSAKKVAMPKIDLPIAAVCLAVSKISGEAVLLDDYKLYPTKVATDFEVYTARLGIKVTETDKAQAEDVAYRLSWMNTNNVEKTYSVVAAYYNGETLASEEVIKEVKMAPNMEGVETGVVELGDKGKSVRVYLRDDNPAEEEPNVGGNGGSDKEPVDGADIDMTTVIIIAAAAVVVIAAVVIIIVVSSKKKAKKASNAEEIPAAEEAPATEEPVAEETPDTDAE